jgi:hypothetical protein
VFARLLYDPALAPFSSASFLVLNALLSDLLALKGPSNCSDVAPFEYGAHNFVYRIRLFLSKSSGDPWR